MQKHVNLVDLVKSFPTNIYLQNLASIQKRTSPIKFAHLAEKSENGSISKLSTKVSCATRTDIQPRLPCMFILSGDTVKRVRAARHRLSRGERRPPLPRSGRVSTLLRSFNLQYLTNKWQQPFFILFVRG